MSDSFVREKLFHPFSQEKPFAQGVGLGLAIGKATFTEENKRGTEFSSPGYLEITGN
jgi:C4-dicarboxylate-specific signal transduction histidine kinase